MNTKQQLNLIRTILIFFTVALFFSGLTAIPLRFELNILDTLLGEGSLVAARFPLFSGWISQVHLALEEQYQAHAFLAYGYDWLAFGHFVIAIAFLGAVKDPVRNRWVIEFGMIACVLILPYAFIMGAVRDIPIYWRFIDMLFGIFGIIPLYIARRMTIQLEANSK
ncbi:MAG: hypothetical protein JXA13_05425 [Anaerolineales bacterium]|nr:hypothetical protein [Anaerolineales bacterium]